MKKKIISMLLVGAMVTSALVGCGNGDNANDNIGVEGEGNLSGTVTVTGSTTVAPVADAAFAKFIEKEEYSEIFVEVQSVGSSDGIRAASEGNADLGMSSRELKAEEEANVDRHVIAYDGIAVIVNNANEVKELTTEQVRDIYTGQISNWNEVGGPDAAIAVISREDGSGTRGAFEEIVGYQDELRADALIQDGTGAIVSAVSGNENAIGYISLGRVDDTITAVTIDGIEASVETVKTGEFPIQRPILMLSKKDTPLTEEAQAYLDFIFSSEGQEIVEEEGFIGVE